MMMLSKKGETCSYTKDYGGWTH